MAALNPLFSTLPSRFSAGTRASWIAKCAVGTRLHAHLAVRAGDGEAGRAFFDDEAADPARAGRRVRLGEDGAEVGDGAAGDVGLLAVEHVVVAVPDGTRAQVGGIGAGRRLREAEGGAFGAGRHRAGPALLLLLCAADHDRLRRERRKQEHEAGRAAVLRHLFDGQAECQHARAGAAVLLGDVQAQQADVLEGLEDVLRVLFLLVDLGGARRHLLAGDSARGGLDQLLLLCELEVHVGAP